MPSFVRNGGSKRPRVVAPSIQPTNAVKKALMQDKKYPLLDFIVILLRPEALEDPHMTILKLGELFLLVMLDGSWTDED